MTDFNDEQLVEKYLKGDAQALEKLIKKYSQIIFGFVYRYLQDVQETENITQEVFVRVWKNIKTFDCTKSFKTWIFTIAKNASLDQIKKKKNIPFSKFDNDQGDNFLTESLTDASPLPDEILHRKDIADKLNSAINQLSNKYSVVLILHYYHQFTFKEISEILEEPLDTVKSRHRRGVIMLKNVLTDSK